MPHAIKMDAYGSPSVLKYVETEKPSLGPNDVWVRVHASAINRADLEIRSGKWPLQCDSPFPYIPGLETCGFVEAKGSKVQLPIGQPVITMMQKMAGIHGIRPGGYQSHVVVPESVLALLNPAIDMDAIAAVGLAGVTAFQAIKRLEITGEGRILIQGASGGVGSLAVMIAKSLGAHVIAITKRSQQIEFLKKIGADEVWVSSQKPLAERASEKVDGALEMVGGQAFADTVACLKRGGRLCSVGALTGGEASLSVWDLLQDLVLTGWSSENLTQKELQESVDGLSELVQMGQLRKPHYSKYPLAEAALAHRQMEEGNEFGRVLLIP